MTKKSKLGLGLAIGAAAGAVAGVLMSDKPGKKLRVGAKKEYTKYNKMLNEKDLEAVARDIFGRTSTLGKKHLSVAKREVKKGVVELHRRSKSVSTAKYKTLVKGVVSKIKSKEGVTPEVLVKLTNYLESDAKKIIKRAPAKKRASTLKKKATKKK